MSDRIDAVLNGVMLAESITWKSMYDRARLLPFWTRRKRREIEAASEEHGLIEPSLPFALNQPTSAFALSPGPHSEWIAFQLRILMKGSGTYDQGVALEAWSALIPQRPSLRLTVAEHSALENLRAGKKPPRSGYENPHYFDDSACFRGIPLALGRDPQLDQTIAFDAQITNAQDGLWAAQAFAACMRAATAGAHSDESVRAAKGHAPKGTWLRTEIERALQASGQASSVFDLVYALSDETVNHAYNYGNSAPETLAIALAIVSYTNGAFDQSLLAALSLPKTSSSVAPLVGALCGALGSEIRVPQGRSTLAGVALPSLAGTDLSALAAEWRALAA